MRFNFSFEDYIKDVKSQLDCNASEEYKKRCVVYTYSNDDIDNNLDYFKKMYDEDYSAYKALLLFAYKPTEKEEQKKEKLKFTDVIKSIGYDQHEILYNIMQLHNDGKPFDCDMTYSIGNFYGTFKIKNENGETREVTIPAPKYKYDVCPQIEGVEKIEPLGPLPLEDNSIDSIVIDLPFVISCGPSLETPDYDENGNKVRNNLISRRFASYYPVAQLLESYTHWIKEAYRVLRNDGILVFKTQGTITGSKFLCTPYYSRLIAESSGFDSYDEFVLLAKNRLISGKVNKQQHARSFHSYFLVFKKSLKKKVAYFDFMTNEEINEVLDGLKSNNLSAKRRKDEKTINAPN